MQGTPSPETPNPQPLRTQVNLPVECVTTVTPSHPEMQGRARTGTFRVNVQPYGRLRVTGNWKTLIFRGLAGEVTTVWLAVGARNVRKSEAEVFVKFDVYRAMAVTSQGVKARGLC